MAGAQHLSTDDFQAALDKAGEADQPVFVDFYAEWCGPCKMSGPVVDKMADDYAGKAVVVKVDVDANNELSGQYGVMSIPTVIVFKKNGDKMEEVDRTIGFSGEDAYRKMVDDALAA